MQEKLIDDILDSVKITFGKISLYLAPVSISKLMSEIYEMFKYKINAKTIKFTLNVDNDIPEYLLIDEKRFS